MANEKGHFERSTKGWTGTVRGGETLQKKVKKVKLKGRRHHLLDAQKGEKTIQKLAERGRGYPHIRNTADIKATWHACRSTKKKNQNRLLRRRRGESKGGSSGKKPKSLKKRRRDQGVAMPPAGHEKKPKKLGRPYYGEKAY